MSGARIQPRSVARLAAVQALYQMEVSGAGVDAVVREFGEHRFDRDVEGERLAAADEKFFAELAKGVVSNQAKVDQGIVKRLVSGWRLERLDATARAVLRAGAFELMFRPDVPTEVVINEYVEIAKSFFEGPESGFINGALDAIARDARD
uniref:transcription antitermination factor NusB n=1 Tax=uncultured Caulobacter sp. TaxID=158749 RepID=UPI0025E878B1|nr:transcription antitermination factor NusB [uncultured Caulobacter sp.]